MRHRGKFDGKILHADRCHLLSNKNFQRYPTRPYAQTWRRCVSLRTDACSPLPYINRSETFRFANRNLPLNQNARFLNDIHCVLINVRPGLGDFKLRLLLALYHTTVRKRLAKRLKLGIAPTSYGSPASQHLTLL
jgi:hypothetical protein